MTVYHLNNEQATTPAKQNVSSTYATQINIANPSSGTLRRIKVIEFSVGQSGAPNATDCDMEWDWARTTAAPTATSATPNPVDPADPASVTVGLINATAEGTVTANSEVAYFAINQRATQRWVSYNDRALLVVPATASNGLSLRAKSPTYATTTGCAVYFDE